MTNAVHPYDNNSNAYNIFFHPLHFKEIEMKVASVVLNIILTLATLGLWLIPFGIINYLDDKKVEEWKAGKPAKAQVPLPPSSGNQATSKVDTLTQALKKIEAIPVPVSDIVLPGSFPLPKDTPLAPPSKAKLVGSEIHTTFGNTKIVLKKGSVVEENTDAVVNAANSKLMGGGGVDGEFWKRSGTIIEKDKEGKIIIQGKSGEFLASQILPIKKKLKSGQLETGGAVITRSINIPSPYIIYTVGPQTEDPKALRNAYASCLKLLVENKLHSISFSCISQNIFGYSPQKAAPIVIDLVRRYCEEKLDKITEIRLNMFTDGEWDAYKNQPEFSTEN